MGAKIGVLVANDHALFREMLCLILHQKKSIKIVGEAVNGLQAIDVISNLKPDVVLLDISMPNMDVIKVITQIREKSPKTKVLVFSKDPEETIIFKALKAGAKGYLCKDLSINDLIKAIQVVHNGELWIERKMMARFFEREAIANSKAEETTTNQDEVLTPREKEVLSCLAKGYSNKEIANALFISEKTVKSHMNNIFRKLKVSRRIEAILYAINRKIR